VSDPDGVLMGRADLERAFTLLGDRLVPRHIGSRRRLVIGGSEAQVPAPGVGQAGPALAPPL
jgi:hypothetical protein